MLDEDEQGSNRYVICEKIGACEGLERKEEVELFQRGALIRNKDLLCSAGNPAQYCDNLREKRI